MIFNRIIIVSLLVTLLNLVVFPLNSSADNIENPSVVKAEIVVDKILGEFSKNANLKVFNKDILFSISNKYLDLNTVSPDEVQMIFDLLLTKLLNATDESQLIGGGLLAVELNSRLGKKRENNIKLANFLLTLLLKEKTDPKIFALKILGSDYFQDESSFPESSRKLLYQAIKRDPSLIDLLGSDIADADNNIIMIVAKMGKTREAIKLLQDIKQQRPSKKLICSAALAKLGVRKDQQALIYDFKHTKDMQEKYQLAYALSLWGSKAAQRALAEELRTPGLVKFNGGRPPEMICFHIAIAFVRTIKEHRDELPKRGAFAWQEEDFIKIENWAAKYLGVSWDKPRPIYSPVEKVSF